MIHRTRLLLDGAALLAALALPSPLLAQAAGRPAPAPESAAPERAQAAPERAVPESDPSARRAAQAQAGGADASDRGLQHREIMAKMRDAEVLHRERLADIHRLRQLAESQGQAERLALLDKLEVKENARYGAAATFAANRLANTSAYKQSLMKLAAGRIRRNVPEDKPVEPGQPPAARKARKEAREAKEATERAAGTQTEDPSAEKPKGERKHRDTATTSVRTRPGSKHKRSGDAGATPPRAEPRPEPTPAPRDGASSGGSRSPRSAS